MTFKFDSFRLDLASLAVLVGFIHDDVAHGGFELVVWVAVAKVLKGLLQPCWRGRLETISMSSLCLIITNSLSVTEVALAMAHLVTHQACTATVSAAV